MGLSGAAAVSAGMAALGGGAVAAGGAGMAGGMAVIVGGGAILGAGTGLGAGHLIGTTAATTALSAAKLQVVLKELILQNLRDTRKMQEILIAQRNYIQELKNTLDDLILRGKDQDEQISQLEASIELMEKSVERSREIMKAA
jgi:hypothetical protein